MDPRSPVASVPLDLLLLIFGLLPLRPRLATVSRVCKHWRAAIVRTVSVLNIYESTPPHVVMRLFPCLRSLSVIGAPVRFALPATLHTLALRTGPKFELSEPFPPISTLDYNLGGPVDALLAGLATSLTTLRLGNASFADHHTGLAGALDRTPLYPSLRILEVSHLPPADVSLSEQVAHLVQRHASQLASLTLRGAYYPDPLRCPFPVLTSLSVSNADLDRDAFLAAIASAPRLTQLTMSYPQDRSAVQYHPAVAPLITELTGVRLADELELLQAMPRLRRLPLGVVTNIEGVSPQLMVLYSEYALVLCCGVCYVRIVCVCVYMRAWVWLGGYVGVCM